MLKTIQKLSVFYISKFEAAAKAMKQSGKQPWVQKISKNQKSQLWALYKQATQGDVKAEMKSGQQMNFQGQQQGSKQSQQQGKKIDQQQAFKDQNVQFQGQQQGQQKGNQGIQGNVSQSVGQQAKQGQSGQSVPQQEQQKYDAWSKYKGKSKQEAQNEYVKFARDLLQKHKAEKYIKDF